MSEYTIIDNKKNLWNPSIVFLVFGTRVSCSSGRPLHFLPTLEEEDGLISIFFSIREWLFQEIILIAALNKLNLKLNWTDGNYDHDILKSWLECVLYFDNLSKTCVCSNIWLKTLTATPHPKIDKAQTVLGPKFVNKTCWSTENPQPPHCLNLKFENILCLETRSVDNECWKNVEIAFDIVPAWNRVLIFWHLNLKPGYEKPFTNEILWTGSD